MTCQHCCGAEKIFDSKTAKKSAERYRKKGPNKTTKILLDHLFKHSENTHTLLDIGGGVGVIQHEYIKNNGGNTTDVDASFEYIEQAKLIGKENNMLNRMNFIHGDFVDVIDKIEPHDIVTLEKVVCCYPHVDALLEGASSKAKTHLAFVYPINNVVSRLFFFVGNIYLRLKKNPFRAFLHDEKHMFKILMEQGFEPVSKSRVFPWKIVVLQRKGEG